MKNQPLISIIVAVYNAEKYLPECLQSLTAQTYQNIEILCINDGSKDNSLAILNQWADKDSRIKVFSQANAGAGTARNVGLDNMTGQYLMFCDADDFYQPDMCEQMLHTITTQNVDFVMCDTNVIEYDKNHGRKKGDINHFRLHFKGYFYLTPWLKSKINVVIWNKIFKNDLIKKYHIRFPETFKAEDNGFIWQYLSISNFMFGLDKTLYNYRLLSSSLMGIFFRKGDVSVVFDQISVTKYAIDFIHQYNLEQNILWLLSILQNGMTWRMSYISQKQSMQYLKLLHNKILKNLDFNQIKQFPSLVLCSQKKYKDLIIKYKKLQSSSFFKIFNKIKINNTKKFYILGIPVFKRKKTETKKKYYLLGINILSRPLKIKNKTRETKFETSTKKYSWKSPQELTNIKEINAKHKYITCFDCLYDSNQEAIDAYTFFRYLQARHIPSKYILLKGNSLKNKIPPHKDIIIVEDCWDFLYHKQDIIAQSKLLLTSFGFPGSQIDAQLKSLPYLQYVFIEHGVILLNKSVLNLYSSNNYNKILTPTRLTYDFYKNNQLWTDERMVCCGLPRWDNLNKQTTSEGIFIFFTWRKTFLTKPELADIYLKEICQFLNKLKETTQGNCHLKIAWHHELAHNNIIIPKLDNDFELIPTDKISDAIKNSQMLITDYSSVSWDFLYQNKPVIYYRFDRDNLYLNETDQLVCLGAMQEDDKLYNCFYEEKEVLKKVNYYINHNFELEPQNKKITDNIFWSQENNCERLYHLLNTSLK